MLLGACLLWIFVVLLAVVLLRELGKVPSFRGWQGGIFLLMAGLLAMVYGRPHNDISGQDGPAYIQCAAEYARHGSFDYQDEMLASVPVENRRAFLYYGHKSSYMTKFGSLNLVDLDEARLRSWFQVAPAMLLALPTKLFGNYAVLFVMPAFALLNGLALALLAVSIFGRSRYSGWLAALFYLASPLIIWHARMVRPEFVASFLLWGGVALLLRAIRRPERYGLSLVGAIAVNLAPFFHITAGMVVLPLSAVIAWQLLNGRRTALLFGGVQALAAGMFVLQVAQYADPYHLGSYLTQIPLGTVWWRWILLGIFGWGGIFMMSFAVRGRLPHVAAVFEKYVILRAGIAILILAVLGGILVAGLHASSAELKSLVYHFYYRTDLRSVSCLVSLPMALSALVGLGLLLVRGGRRAGYRYIFCLLALPAALGVGNMYDFFTTRYLLVSMMPLLTLSLVSAVRWILSIGLVRKYRLSQVAVVLAVVVMLLHRRLLLVRQVDRQGLRQGLEQAANEIKNHNGILLCEYSRVAGTLEHVFGVPTLGLDGEHSTSYGQAIKSWRSVMQQHPGQPAYFISPFDYQPRNRLMRFEAIGKFRIDMTELVDNRWDLPTKVRDNHLSLYLYRIYPGNTNAVDATITMTPGNMGLARFSACRNKSRVAIEGVALSEQHPLDLSGSLKAEDSVSELWVMLHSPAGVSKVMLDVAGQSHAVPLRRLNPEWSLLRVSDANLRAGVRIWATGPVIASQAFWLYNSDKGGPIIKSVRFPADSPRIRQTVKPFVARWGRQHASIALPPAGAQGAVLLMFMTPPEEAGAKIAVKTTLNGLQSEQTLPGGHWQWSAIYAPPQTPASAICFETNKPFNPKVRGFAEDLILFMGYGNFIQL